MAFGRVQNIAVVVHKTEIPDKSDWSAVIQFIMKFDALDGIFVLAPRGKPDATMRGDVHELYKRYNMSIAVMTSSRVSQGVLTALRWFGIPTQGFSPDALGQAFEFLGLQPDEPELMAAVQPYLELFS